MNMRDMKNCAAKFFIRHSGGSRISPRRGRQLQGGAPTHDLAIIFPKMHEIERIWNLGEGGGVPRAPLDPPLRQIKFELNTKYVFLSVTGERASGHVRRLQHLHHVLLVHRSDQRTLLPRLPVLRPRPVRMSEESGAPSVQNLLQTTEEGL